MASFDVGELAIHHARHGFQFPGKSDVEYEKLAERFLLSQPGPTTMECLRSAGDRIRYDTLTEEFGVMSKQGKIRSYFYATPCWTLTDKTRGRCHGYSDNITCFNERCQKARKY